MAYLVRVAVVAVVILVVASAVVRLTLAYPPQGEELGAWAFLSLGVAAIGVWAYDRVLGTRGS